MCVYTQYACVSLYVRVNLDEMKRSAEPHEARTYQTSPSKIKVSVSSGTTEIDGLESRKGDSAPWENTLPHTPRTDLVSSLLHFTVGIK